MIFGALFQKKQNGTTEAYYCTINTFRHCELYSFDAATLWSYFNVENILEAARRDGLHDFVTKAKLLASKVQKT